MNTVKYIIPSVIAALLIITPVIAAEGDMNQQGMQNNQQSMQNNNQGQFNPNQGFNKMQNFGSPAQSGEQQSQQSGAQNFPGNQGNQGNQGPPNQGFQNNQGFQGGQFAAQNNQPGPGQQSGPSGQQPTAFGVVISVDSPDNCLRLRQSPTSQSSLVGCAQINEKLPLTGQWSQDGRWLQTANNSWVYASQVKTDLKPPMQARSVRRSGGDMQPSVIFDIPATQGYTDTGIVYGPGFYGGYGGFRFGSGHHHHHHK
jgi:hypothetical protein